jgi:hypothetical protein
MVALDPHTRNMIYKSTGRSGTIWARQRLEVLTQEHHCYLCQLPIDPTLPPSHRMAGTVDHIDEDHTNCDRNNLRAAHRSCNSRKSNLLRPRHGSGESPSIIAVFYAGMVPRKTRPFHVSLPTISRGTRDRRLDPVWWFGHRFGLRMNMQRWADVGA